MITYFPNTLRYLETLDAATADPLDKKAYELIMNEAGYERASQALRRRFVRGAEIVDGIDRGGRKTRIKRVKEGNLFKYFVEGSDGSWSSPDERIWIVAMYALWQDKK